jgi:DNA-binding XRE family transcriptional regulator
MSSNSPRPRRTYAGCGSGVDGGAGCAILVVSIETYSLWAGPRGVEEHRRGHFLYQHLYCTIAATLVQRKSAIIPRKRRRHLDNNLYALSVYRTWAGLSQEELAELSGVARNTISRLERGHQPARPSTARKLAKALGTTPKELMDFETARIAGG